MNRIISKVNWEVLEKSFSLKGVDFLSKQETTDYYENPSEMTTTINMQDRNKFIGTLLSIIDDKTIQSPDVTKWEDLEKWQGIILGCLWILDGIELTDIQNKPIEEFDINYLRDTLLKLKFN